MRLWQGVSVDRTLYPPGDGPHLDRREQVPLLASGGVGGKHRAGRGRRDSRRGGRRPSPTKAGFSVARIQEIEAEVKHDVIAFTTAVAESLNAQGLGEQSRWLHYGLTSNDVVDTAQALQVKEASALIR